MQKNIISAVVFGLIGAVGFMVYFYIIYLLFQNPFLPNPKSIDFFIYLLTITGGIAYFRFKRLKGKLSFWQGVSNGFVITFCMASLTAVWIFVFLSYIDLEVLQLYIQDTIQKMKINEAQNIKAFGKEIYGQIITQLKNTSPFDMAMYEWRSKLVLGSLITLVSAVVLRK